MATKTNMTQRELGELGELLEKYTFNELLERGDVLRIKDAMAALGYKSAWGLRWACKHGEIGHVKRGHQYFFLRSQVRAAFAVVSASRP